MIQLSRVYIPFPFATAGVQTIKKTRQVTALKSHHLTIFRLSIKLTLVVSFHLLTRSFNKGQEIIIDTCRENGQRLEGTKIKIITHLDIHIGDSLALRQLCSTVLSGQTVS